MQNMFSYRNTDRNNLRRCLCLLTGRWLPTNGLGSMCDNQLRIDQVSFSLSVMQESMMGKVWCVVHFWSICILHDEAGENIGNELLMGILYVAIKVWRPGS